MNSWPCCLPMFWVSTGGEVFTQVVCPQAAPFPFNYRIECIYERAAIFFLSSSQSRIHTTSQSCLTPLRRPNNNPRRIQWHTIVREKINRCDDCLFFSSGRRPFMQKSLSHEKWLVEIRSWADAFRVPYLPSLSCRCKYCVNCSSSLAPFAIFSHISVVLFRQRRQCH